MFARSTKQRQRKKSSTDVNDTFATRQKNKRRKKSKQRNEEEKQKTEKFAMCLYSKTIVSISSLMRCARQFPRLRIIEFAKYVLRFHDSSLSSHTASPETTLLMLLLSLRLSFVCRALCVSQFFSRTLSTVSAIIELSKRSKKNNVGKTLQFWVWF